MKRLERPRQTLRLLFSYSLTLVFALSCVAQADSNKSETATAQKDEGEFVRILIEQEVKRDPKAVIVALNGLTKLFRLRLVGSAEAYIELTRYLDFEVAELGASPQTNLDTHPAMAALYYAGEPALPYLVDVITQEKEDSKTFSLALGTIIYIKDGNYRLTYAYLSEIARHAKNPSTKKKLLTSAQKAAALDPEILPPPTSRTTPRNDWDEESEAEAVAILRRNREGLTDISAVRDAFRKLENIGKFRIIKSLETISVVSQYLDVHDRELDPSFRPRNGHAIDVDEAYYPAVRVLYYSGKEGLPVLLKVIESESPESLKSQNALHLIKNIYGSEWNDAATYLRENAGSAKTEAGKQNLLIAADKVTRSIP